MPNQKEFLSNHILKALDQAATNGYTDELLEMSPSQVMEDLAQYDRTVEEYLEDDALLPEHFATVRRWQAKMRKE